MSRRTPESLTLLVSIACSSTRQPQIGRFVRGSARWDLVGISRQRLGVQFVGDDTGQTKGSFGVVDDYRGCPTCGSDGFVKCGNCDRLACYDSSWPLFHCPSCDNSGPVEGEIDEISRVGQG